MGVDQEISRLIDAIQKTCPDLPMHFRGAVQVFRAGMSKASRRNKESEWKAIFVAHANQVLSDAEQVLNLIPAVSSDFLQHGLVILTNGFDPIVASVLQVAASDGRQFHVVVTEGRPRNDGVKLAAMLKHPNLIFTVIPDAAVGLWMNEAHVVLVGTDLVLQDGGLLAPVGTYNLCVLAAAHKRPVYCVCETFKFMRKFVLSDSDMGQFQRKLPFEPLGGGGGEVRAEAREFDFTPPQFVTLLLTEKGPIPPSAVTHELAKLLGVA
jgi:translation initiation factor eIF-2B subunit alpha